MVVADKSLEIRQQDIIENSTFSFSDAEVILSGGIIEFKIVAGAWEEVFDGTNGTFQREKQ